MLTSAIRLFIDFRFGQTIMARVLHFGVVLLPTSTPCRVCAALFSGSFVQFFASLALCIPVRLDMLTHRFSITIPDPGCRMGGALQCNPC